MINKPKADGASILPTPSLNHCSACRQQSIGKGILS